MALQASAGRFETHEIGEQAQAASPWDVVHRQMSRGKFRVSTEYLQLNNILCYRQHWTKRTLVKGTPPKGFVMLGGSYSPRSSFIWCGSELNAQYFAKGQSSSEVDFIIPDNSDHWVLLVSHHLLLKQIEHRPQIGRLLENTTFLLSEPGPGGVINTLVPRIIQYYAAHSELLNQGQVRNRLESQLLETVLQCTDSEDVGARSIFPGRRGLIFRRAIEFVESLPPHDPISVPELAKAVGVSQRLLELVFKEKLGVTPNRFLRWFHINRAYHDLLRAPSKGSSTVTEVATLNGFTEMGRFACEYKRLLGESPSTTLQRTMKIQPKSFADIMLA